MIAIKDLTSEPIGALALYRATTEARIDANGVIPMPERVYIHNRLDGGRIVMIVMMIWHDDDCSDEYDEYDDGDMKETGGNQDGVLSGKDR